MFSLQSTVCASCRTPFLKSHQCNPYLPHHLVRFNQMLVVLLWTDHGSCRRQSSLSKPSFRSSFCRARTPTATTAASYWPLFLFSNFWCQSCYFEVWNGQCKIIEGTSCLVTPHIRRHPAAKTLIHCATIYSNVFYFRLTHYFTSPGYSSPGCTTPACFPNSI